MKPLFYSVSMMASLLCADKLVFAEPVTLSVAPTIPVGDVPLPEEKQAGEWLQQVRALRKNGRDRDAEVLLRQIVALSEPVRVPGQPLPNAGGLGYGLRYSRAEAHQQLGEVLFARQDYEGALQLFRTRPLIWEQCGNGAMGRMLEDVLWQGACLEGLGRTREAVVLYAPNVLPGLIADNPNIARRVEEIYAVNGKTQELIRFVNLADAQFKRDWEKDTDSLEPYRREEDRPTHTLRDAMRLRALEKNGDWVGLVALFDRAASGRVGWLFEATLRALARHPGEVTKPLMQNFENALTPQGARNYALGLCGTPEAATFLQGQLTRPDVQNIYFARSLVYALSLCGKDGARVLAEAEANTEMTPGLRSALQLWRENNVAELSQSGAANGLSTPHYPPVKPAPLLPSAQQLLALASTDRKF